ERGVGVVNDDRLAGCLRHQLRLAASLHSDEPPSGLIDAVAHGEQAMISHDDCLCCSERLSNTRAFGSIEHQALEVVEERMVAVEGAGVLRQRIEEAA